MAIEQNGAARCSVFRSFANRDWNLFLRSDCIDDVGGAYSNIQKVDDAIIRLNQFDVLSVQIY
ncbi:MAG: hypothetical protein CMJ77_08560 [Planctomycetaceae bacterium]|nr:hypothetical protein [Planctomycetaceae bacterium]